MAFSYSFHLSSKGHAVSTTGKITQASKHNLRRYESKDYDRSQIEVLQGSDNILEDVRKIYHEQFDEVLQKYNNKQKRADRRIDDYLEHVSNSRSDVAAEIIIQIGDKAFWSTKSMDEKRQMTYIFKDQLRALETICPEFKMASAVIHYDEASPHLHVVGVPVAEGYQKGLEKQVAKTKVFTAERLSMLQDQMREYAAKGIELNPDLFDDQKLKEKELGRNKDIPKAALDRYYEVKEYVEKMDISTSKMASNALDDAKVEEYTIREKQGLFGHSERSGVFIEGVTPEDIKNISKRAKMEEKLVDSVIEAELHRSAIISNATEKAKEIRSEATAEKNDKIAEAQQILQQKNSIIQQAMQLVREMQRKYDDLRNKVKELLGQKARLEKEVAAIQNEKETLEPLRKEVMQLQKSRDVLAGEYENQLSQTKFVDLYELPLKIRQNYTSLRDKGELLALYNDGTIRKVGSNERGGMDYKTLEDQDKGLCRVGVMRDEPKMRVPIKLLQELIQKRDRSKEVSPELGNLMQQMDGLKTERNQKKRDERV